MGQVFTWGCNDEGALGREGAENTPLPVADTLKIPVTDICAGDSHTVAYNAQINQVYMWGLYRVTIFHYLIRFQNAMSGKFHEGVRVPTRIGQELFKGKVSIKKLASGAHHTLALTADGKVYAWGDPESGKLGRILNTRNKDHNALMIEKVKGKDITDIFCGNHHSFYINKKGEVYSWGLNNHGQLGVGHKENISLPEKITALEGMTIVMMAGGEHHSIAVNS